LRGICEGLVRDCSLANLEICCSVGDISKGVVTKNMSNLCMTIAVVSQREPKNVEEAL